MDDIDLAATEMTSPVSAVVAALEGAQRMRAAIEAFEIAGRAALMAAAIEVMAANGRDGDLPLRAMAAEVGAALRMNDRTVQRQLAEAHDVSQRFPASVQALAAGRITRRHLDVIVDAGACIDDDATRASFESAVLQVAERESAARTRPVARVLAHRAMPRSFERRHLRARRDRAVWVTDLEDGMATLHATLPATLAHGILDRLTRMGMAAREAEARGRSDGNVAVPDAAAGGADGVAVVVPSLHERRADLLADLALTGMPTTCGDADLLGVIRAEVHITVPVLTLAAGDLDAAAAGGVGCDRAEVRGAGLRGPAMLEGRTPIDARTARILAGDATGWNRVLTHPVTGTVLAVDRYRPSRELRRLMRAIDQRCRFPCCTMPARRCDLDHIRDAALGGPTSADNLASECERHHVMKHQTAWRVDRDEDGALRWTSPSGQVYPDRVPTVCFAEPPPNSPSSDLSLPPPF